MPPENLSALFDRLRRAADAQTEVPWPLRQDRLQRLAKMLREQCLAIAEAIDADFSGRSRHETDLLELFPSLAGIRHALKHGKKWMRPRKVATEWYFWPGKSRILPQPLGLVGIVAPWNYPLYLPVSPPIMCCCPKQPKPSLRPPPSNGWRRITRSWRTIPIIAASLIPISTGASQAT